MGPSADIHDSIASRNGSFNDTLRGIKHLKEKGFAPVVNIVISKKNKDYVKDTINFLASLGIKHITSTRAGCPGNCSDFSEMSLSFKEFQKYLDDLYVAGQEAGVSVGVLESYPYCGMKYLLRYQQFLNRRCSAGITTITVGSNGSVRPCSHLDIQYGNLLKEDLDKIWSRMKKWRDGSMIPLECKNCKLFYFCGSGCRMEAKMRGGALNAMDPYSCPDDIDIVLQQFYKLPKKENKIISSFSLSKKIRWRKEKFGSAVFLAHNFKVFLNKKATDFLNKLDSEKNYTIEEIIKWGDYSSKELQVFLSKLADKKIILERPRKTMGGEEK
jgi:radical SAM protein with 4Fe4S-binding SPASM domain